MLKTYRQILTVLFASILVVGVAAAMVVGSQALCCEVDPKMLGQRLVLAAAFGSAGTSILGRIRFHGWGWQGRWSAWRLGRWPP